MVDQAKIVEMFEAVVRSHLVEEARVVEEWLAQQLVQIPVSEWDRIVIDYECSTGVWRKMIKFKEREPHVGFGERMPVLTSLWKGLFVTITYENDQPDYEAAKAAGEPNPAYGSAAGEIIEVVWDRQSPTICLDWGWCIPLFSVHDIQLWGKQS